MAKHFLLFLLLTGAVLIPHRADAQTPANPPKPVSSKPATSPKPTSSPNPTKPAIPQPKTTTSPQSNPYPITLLDSAIHFADSIFHHPTILYQLVEPDLPADIQSIVIRFNNAIVANSQWFQDYRADYAGKPLPYNQRFGISAAEYQRLQTLQNTPPQLVPADTQQVTVARDAGFIQFHTSGDVRLLDFLLIDPKNNILVFGGDTVPFLGHTVTTASNPYGEWEGYTWRLEKADAASTIATSLVTARVIEINMGLAPPQTPTGNTPAQTQPAQPGQPMQPEQTHPTQPTQPQTHPTQPPQPQSTPHNRIFLRLKYQDMQEGTTKANLELIGYLL